jgi:short-subunit dehydrogenase
VMRKRRSGHIVNVSSIGVQTNTPRFSAYVASKAALEAFSRCIASEIAHDGVDITTVHMPLVRTRMIEPTPLYRHLPAASPEEAAAMISEAIVKRPKRLGTVSGNLAQLSYGVAPRAQDALLNTAYRFARDSPAAKGGEEAGESDAGTASAEESPGEERPTD